MTYRMQFQKSSSVLLPKDKPKQNGTKSLKVKNWKRNTGQLLTARKLVSLD